jgi:hypothetical protein
MPSEQYGNDDRYKVQGPTIRGPRKPVHVCDDRTHLQMHATSSLWSKSLDRFGSQHAQAPGEQRTAPYPPDAA